MGHRSARNSVERRSATCAARSVGIVVSWQSRQTTAASGRKGDLAFGFEILLTTVLWQNVKAERANSGVAKIRSPIAKNKEALSLPGHSPWSTFHATSTGKPIDRHQPAGNCRKGRPGG